jgi:Transposase DDE domain
MKLQVRLEMRTGRLDVQLQDRRASDRAAELPGKLQVETLRVADLGYWRLDAFRALTQQGVFWLSRLQVQTALYEPTGQRQDLLALLTAQPTATLDRAVTLGEAQRLPARLLVICVPQEVAATRRRRLREAACKKGRKMSATRLALAAWTLLVANMPGDRLTLQEALMLAHVRWQIELLFELWKSHGRVDESRSTKPWRILRAVYAKLLAMLVPHRVFLVGCWAYPNRSLVKAAQMVQKHALHPFSAFGSLQHLIAALTTVQRCVAAGRGAGGSRLHSDHPIAQHTDRLDLNLDNIAVFHDARLLRQKCGSTRVDPVAGHQRDVLAGIGDEHGGGSATLGCKGDKMR